jgi:hypothetical protein
LVTRNREIMTTRLAANPLMGTDFDTCARSIGVETIGYVDHFTVTPILTPDGTACVALLFESPEPLEAGTRLSISVDLIAGMPKVNVDGTRFILTPAQGTTFGLSPLAVRLTWRRNAGTSMPILAIRGDVSDEVIDFIVDAGEGLV